MITRNPVCAGTWYPVERKKIAQYLDETIKPQDSLFAAPRHRDRKRAVACVCPHAGWMYSGYVAGSVYSTIDISSYDTFVLIGPNHTGRGARSGVFSEGVWNMPLGPVKINDELAGAILRISEFLESDAGSHINEHCLEVQLPFIQYFNPSAKIVPIVLMNDEFEVCADIANAVSSAVKKLKLQERTLIIASTDMTHYENHSSAAQKDNLAIENILSLDAEGLVKTVTSKGISMCGVFATATVMLSAVHLGAKSAELIKYATSGDVTGDNSAVVGYAGLIIE